MKNMLVALLIVSLCLGLIPPRQARADSSDGVAISVGLLAVLVGTYCLVALRSDVERYSQAERDARIAEAVRKAEESPIILQAITEPVASSTHNELDRQSRVSGASIGLRVTF